MSSRKDNINTKLKEFLAKNKNSAEGLDDFEKEALEGFAMLENEDEILDLKTNVDKRAYSEVFTGEKTSRRNYWYAAAGLLLIMGLTVYFIQNAPVQETETLAVGTRALEATDEVQKDLRVQPKAMENHKPGESETQPERSVAYKKPEVDGPAFKNIPGKGEEGISTQGFASASDAVVAASPPAAPELRFEPAVAEKKEVKKEIPQQPVIDSEEEDLKQERAAAKDDLAKISAAESETGQVVMLEEIQATKTSGAKKKSKKTEQVTAAGAASTSGGYFATTGCTYSGGDEALAKDLRVSLGARNLLQKFDATLFINKKKKVEKVVLTNSYELNKLEQKQLIEVLKDLDKFNLNETASQASLVEYKVVFRP